MSESSLLKSIEVAVCQNTIVQTLRWSTKSLHRHIFLILKMYLSPVSRIGPHEGRVRVQRQLFKVLLTKASE